MESFALPIFRAGHVPVIGEWLALPLVHAAGSQRVGDDAFNQIFHPVAIRLLDKCDSVLRVGGPSAGADEMVRRWVYLHSFKPTQPTLNWLDPSYAARRATSVT